MPFHRPVLALLPLLLATACVNENVDPTLTAQSHTIGIAYALSDQIDYEHRGFTVFSNTSSKSDISAWHLASTFFAAAKPLLAAKYTVVTAELPSAVFDDANNSVLGLWPSTDAIRTAFAGKLPHADMWIILQPSCMGHGSGGPYPCGIGITSAFNTPLVGIWAGISVYNGTTFAQIANQPLVITATVCDLGPENDQSFITRSLSRALNSGAPKSCPPAKPLDPTWTYQDPAQTSQTQTLKPLYQDLLNRSAAPTLRALSLIN